MANIKNKKVGTYKDFVDNGFYPSGDVTMQRGYTRRKEPIMDKDVYLVERGPHSGQVFILMPSYESTRYCLRVYLTKLERSAQNVQNNRN